jgi:hypothetical protein
MFVSHILCAAGEKVKVIGNTVGESVDRKGEIAMLRVGVWERDGSLCRTLEADLAGTDLPQPVWLWGSHPAQLAGVSLDLLVAAPDAVGWAGAGKLTSRLVLLPGSAAPLARGMRLEGAVSYGAGPKNTITLSSLEGERLCLAIQRELVTVVGGVVERQELVLPCPTGQSPDLLMARVGALLLLGLPPAYSAEII